MWICSCHGWLSSYVQNIYLQALVTTQIDQFYTEYVLPCSISMLILTWCQKWDVQCLKQDFQSVFRLLFFLSLFFPFVCIDMITEKDKCFNFLTSK